MSLILSTMMVGMANAWLEKMMLTEANSEFIGIENDPTDPSVATALFRRYLWADSPVDFENASDLDSQIARRVYRKMNILDIDGLEQTYFDSKPNNAAELMGTFGNFTGHLPIGLLETDLLDPIENGVGLLIQCAPTSLIWYGSLTLIEGINYP